MSRRAAVMMLAVLAMGVGGALRGAALPAQESAAREDTARSGAAQGVTSQTPASAPDAQRWRAAGVWTAVGRDEPLATRLGWTHDRDLYVVGVRFVRPAGAGGAVRFAYTLDLIPALVMTGNPVYASTRSRLVRRPVLERTETVYGFGLAPLGGQLHAALGGRTAVVARMSGGAALFTHRVPDPSETRFNFTADASAALELRLTRALAASAGFRYHHLSNAGTGRANPGMNTRMVEVGVERMR